MIDWLRADAAAPEVEIGGRMLPIELRRMRRAKRLTLRLAPDGSAVRMTLPQWCATAEAIAFVHARKAWLAAELAKVPEPCDPVTSGRIAYRGSDLAVAFASDKPRKPRIEDRLLHVGGVENTLAKRLARWLEAEALELFESDAAEYCDRAGISTAPVRLTRAKRRWGSCSSEGVLRINWRLVQAPDPVRRSVVAHEVAHLLHFDHSPAFHAMMDKIFEGDLAAANRWLSQNGRGLYAAFG